MSLKNIARNSSVTLVGVPVATDCIGDITLANCKKATTQDLHVVAEIGW